MQEKGRVRLDEHLQPRCGCTQGKHSAAAVRHARLASQVLRREACGHGVHEADDAQQDVVWQGEEAVRLPRHFEEREVEAVSVVWQTESARGGEAGERGAGQGWKQVTGA